MTQFLQQQKDMKKTTIAVDSEAERRITQIRCMGLLKIPIHAKQLFQGIIET